MEEALQSDYLDELPRTPRKINFAFETPPSKGSGAMSARGYNTGEIVMEFGFEELRHTRDSLRQFLLVGMIASALRYYT